MISVWLEVVGIDVGLCGLTLMGKDLLLFCDGLVSLAGSVCGGEVRSFLLLDICWIVFYYTSPAEFF